MLELAMWKVLICWNPNYERNICLESEFEQIQESYNKQGIAPINFIIMSSNSSARFPLSRINLLNQERVGSNRNILISHQKLPKDFFSKPSLRRGNSSINSRPNLFTRAIERNFSYELGSEMTPKRESQTARQLKPEREEDLILGIISASQEVKREIRKHSLEFKTKENVFFGNPGFQKAKGSGQRIELPPLLIKKGVTLAF